MENESKTQLKIKCNNAALRTESWMIDHINSENIYSKDHPDPVYYYKWPLTFFARNRLEESKELFHWICEKSLTVDGDFKSTRSGFHLEFHNYANLWLLLAAIKLGEDKIAEQLTRNILAGFNKSTGGLVTNPASMEFYIEDPLSSSFLGLAMTELTNKSIADKILTYLTHCVDQQTEANHFWLRTNRDGTLIRQIPPGADPKTYVLHLGKENESYYFLGSICLFLTSYITAFDDDHCHALAYRIAEILENIGEHALHTIWAAKVAPGCTGLYACTSDTRFLNIAIPVIDAVLAGQTKEGYWLKDNKPWITVSAEQCYWLTFIGKRL